MYRATWIEKESERQFCSEVFRDINDAWDYLNFLVYPENILDSWVEEAEWGRVEE